MKIWGPLILVLVGIIALVLAGRSRAPLRPPPIAKTPTESAPDDSDIQVQEGWDKIPFKDLEAVLKNELDEAERRLAQSQFEIADTRLRCVKEDIDLRLNRAPHEAEAWAPLLARWKELSEKLKSADRRKEAGMPGGTPLRGSWEYFWTMLNAKQQRLESARKRGLGRDDLEDMLFGYRLIKRDFETFGSKMILLANARIPTEDENLQQWTDYCIAEKKLGIREWGEIWIRIRDLGLVLQRAQDFMAKQEDPLARWYGR